MTFIVVPHGGGDRGTRSFEVSYARLRAVAVLLLLGGLLGVAALVSWASVAVQAARVPALQSRITQLEAENARVTQLAQALGRLERQYTRMRTMLGADRAPQAGGVPLPALPPDDSTAAAPDTNP